MTRTENRRTFLRKALKHPSCPPQLVPALRVRLAGRRWSITTTESGVLVVDRRLRSRRLRLTAESWRLVRALEMMADRHFAKSSSPAPDIRSAEPTQEAENA